MRQLQTSPSPAPGQRAPTVARRWTYDDDEEKQERGDDNETCRGDLLRRRDVQDAIFVVVNLLFRVGVGGASARARGTNANASVFFIAMRRVERDGK